MPDKKDRKEVERDLNSLKQEITSLRNGIDREIDREERADRAVFMMLANGCIARAENELAQAKKYLDCADRIEVIRR